MDPGSLRRQNSLKLFSLFTFRYLNGNFFVNGEKKTMAVNNGLLIFLQLRHK